LINNIKKKKLGPLGPFLYLVWFKILFKNNFIKYNKIIIMDILIKKNPNELVIPETVNFIELVKSSNTKLSFNCQSKMVDLLNKEFTEQES
jgi:hypothetical protein